MNGMDRYHGQLSRLSRSGFISALFLSIFLCLCLYTGILAANIRNRSEVILNLKREQEYFLLEADVIREAMCTLQKEKKQAEEKEKEETEEETGEAEKTGEESEEWLGDTEKLTDQLEGSILRITAASSSHGEGSIQCWGQLQLREWEGAWGPKAGARSLG